MDSAAQPNEDEAQSLRADVQRLQAQLVQNARHLAAAIDAAVEGAPLNQLSSALSATIDRYLKLEQYLARTNQQAEQVIRIEFVYPDGSVHDAPPWAEADSEESGPVSGGGLWSPFRQDGSWQNPDCGTESPWSDLLVAGANLPDGG